MTDSIYGPYEAYLPQILEDFTSRIEAANSKRKQETGYKLYEHLIARVKDPASMAEKCQRKGLELSSKSALKDIRDSLGIRLVCGFVSDIYDLVELIRSFPDCRLVTEKDYISQAKPNGYRSYHLIIELVTDFPDVLGQEQGSYFIEIQLRTIAQDSWASLEHQMKYKHDIKDAKRIERELKRCADELASCDMTMQTIRDLISES